MAKNSHLSFRLPTPLKREIAAEAKADHRSITSLVVKILTERRKPNLAEAAK